MKRRDFFKRVLAAAGILVAVRAEDPRIAAWRRLDDPSLQEEVYYGYEWARAFAVTGA